MGCSDWPGLCYVHTPAGEDKYSAYLEPINPRESEVMTSYPLKGKEKPGRQIHQSLWLRNAGLKLSRFVSEFTNHHFHYILLEVCH